MNTLRQSLWHYVAMRRGLGYKFVHQEHRLSGFITFMEQRGAAIITTKLALEWATQPLGRHASWVLRLSDVRGFARHLHGLEPRTEIPPTGIIAYRSRTRPYLYTQEEIKMLLEAALALPPVHGLRRWTYHCLFGLLAVTGLRISEALALRREDVDLETDILTIRDTKFGKSRLVPLHRSTQQVLLDYARRRDAHLVVPRSPYFLVAERGGRLLPQYVYRVFWRLSRQTGLRSASAHSGPRLHDFRHCFAVATLLDWYRSGRSVDTLMPVLSTYLGHSCIRDTYWYLSACPELMDHAARRLEKRWEGSP
jgi:integrase